MAVPDRAPAGAQTVDVIGANLFQLAERYLGDARQWGRIADLNGFPGAPPDFLIEGQATLLMPAARKGKEPPPISVERQLFGVDA